MTTCSPGSHPHTDRPNWRPGETLDEYMRNRHEGLETFSKRRVAKLIGWTRVDIWRATLTADIPEDSFELLVLASDPPSPRELANVALTLRDNHESTDIERCPHCRTVLRVRGRLRKTTREVLQRWLIAREGTQC
jgi:hypothetical protein